MVLNLSHVRVPGSLLMLFFLQAYAPLGRMKVADNPMVTSIAESLGKTPAQIALRWGIQQGQSVLPKSANESRLKENIDLFGWSIPQELCAKFSEIEQVQSPCFQSSVSAENERVCSNGFCRRQPELYITENACSSW